MQIYDLRLIGRVESPFIDPADAPKQGDEGARSAWLIFESEIQEGLSDLKVGDHIIVITWLHLARRDVLRTYPPSAERAPSIGVFSLRSPDRPNPIGLHPVKVLDISASESGSATWKLFDGTPIVDVKPVIGRVESR